MSVREYIGARYVPMFADPVAWDSTKTYEPLTVVIYLGNSYTSRQYVPAGIDISNGTYWVQTGNYNAQIEQYRSDVTALAGVLPSTAFDSTNTVKKYVDDEIDTIEDIIGSGFDSTNTVAKAIGDVDDKLGTGFDSTNTVAKAIDDVDDKLGTGFDSTNTVAKAITALETKPIMVVIGDSWSNPDSTVKWPIHVANSLGMTLRNFAHGGVGYMRDKTDCFYDQLTQAASDVDSTNVAKVYIFGGLNDAYRQDVYYSMFTNTVNTTLAYAKQLFPNSEIIVAGIQRYQNGNIAYNTTALNFFKIELFTTILSNSCADNGCTFISLQNYGITGNSIYNSDGHPNEKGYRSIASKLLGGNYSHNENLNLAAIGMPKIIYGDGTEVTAFGGSPNVICKGGDLYTVGFGFNINTSKFNQTAILDFCGAPSPGQWPLLLGIDTGTCVNLDPTNYYSLSQSEYGSTGYLSTYTIRTNRASLATNTLVAISYDFKM